MVFVVRVTLTPFLVNFSGDLELNPPLPTATTVFRLTGRPLTRRLWRMALIFVTNASLTIEGRPCQRTVKNSTSSWLSEFFWYLIFQSYKSFSFKTKLRVHFWCPSSHLWVTIFSCMLSYFLFYIFRQNLSFLFLFFLVPEDCSVLLQLKVQRMRKSLGWKCSMSDHPIYHL